MATDLDVDLVSKFFEVFESDFFVVFVDFIGILTGDYIKLLNYNNILYRICKNLLTNFFYQINCLKSSNVEKLL